MLYNVFDHYHTRKSKGIIILVSSRPNIPVSIYFMLAPVPSGLDETGSPEIPLVPGLFWLGS